MSLEQLQGNRYDRISKRLDHNTGGRAKLVH